jgi:hypothetical protein
MKKEVQAIRRHEELPIEYEIGDDDVFEDYNAYLDLRAQKYLAYEDETALDFTQYEPVRQSAFKIVNTAGNFTQENSKIGILIPQNEQQKIVSNKKYLTLEETKDAHFEKDEQSAFKVINPSSSLSETTSKIGKTKDANFVGYEPIKQQSAFKIINNANKFVHDNKLNTKFERTIFQENESQNLTSNNKFFTYEDADGNKFVQYEPKNQSKIETIKNIVQEYQLTKDFNDINKNTHIQKLILQNAKDNLKLKRLLVENEKNKNLKTQRLLLSKEPNLKNPVIYEEAFLESSNAESTK